MEENVKNAIEKTLNDNDIELISVQFAEEDNVKTLFITIDSINGVDTDLCVKVTNLISPIIDSLNLDIEDYILDVGSKGE